MLVEHYAYTKDDIQVRLAWRLRDGLIILSSHDGDSPFAELPIDEAEKLALALIRVAGVIQDSGEGT